jgi:hypothetical protein
MGFDYREHWPNDTPREKYRSFDMPPKEWRQVTEDLTEDLERCGHNMTANGVRLYPEGYIVLSEVDVQRIAQASAKAAVDAYLVEVEKEWLRIQGQPREMEFVELEGSELSDSEIERIGKIVVKMLRKKLLGKVIK